jgi:hypothetical protein
VEEIKVGDYVRVNGIIGKVEQIGNSLFWIENGSSYSLDNKKVKYSSNIIDLIEVGDIVEYQVNSLSKLKVGRVKKYRDARDNSEYLGVEGFDVTKIYIKTILTHEQYNANCYKVR